MTDLPRVLIVDDNEPDIFIAKHLIDSSDRFSNACEAHDGEEALELFAEPQASSLHRDECYPPDLVLLDINMPKMDGFEFLERLKTVSDRPTVVIVMVTSSENDAEIARASKFPYVRGFLTKPLTAEAVEKLANEHFSEPAP